MQALVSPIIGDGGLERILHEATGSNDHCPLFTGILCFFSFRGYVLGVVVLFRGDSAAVKAAIMLSQPAAISRSQQLQSITGQHDNL